MTANENLSRNITISIRSVRRNRVSQAMHNVSIHSYLSIRGKSYLVSEYNGDYPHKFYISGWIDMKIDDQVVLDQRHEDLVDQLWVYILSGATEIQRGAENWKSYFPDQPLRITMQSTSPREMLFSVGAASFPVCKTEFFRAIALEAGRFFERMQKLTPEDGKSWLLFQEQAEQLRLSVDRSQ